MVGGVREMNRRAGHGILMERGCGATVGCRGEVEDEVAATGKFGDEGKGLGENSEVGKGRRCGRRGSIRQWREWEERKGVRTGMGVRDRCGARALQTTGIGRESEWTAREREKKIGRRSGLRGSRVRMRGGGNQKDSGRIGFGWVG